MPFQSIWANQDFKKQGVFLVSGGLKEDGGVGAQLFDWALFKSAALTLREKGKPKVKEERDRVVAHGHLFRCFLVCLCECVQGEVLLQGHSLWQPAELSGGRQEEGKRQNPETLAKAMRPVN